MPDSKPTNQASHSMTQRITAIHHLTAEGMSAIEIAKQLNISVPTVYKYRPRVENRNRRSAPVDPFKPDPRDLPTVGINSEEPVEPTDQQSQQPAKLASLTKKIIGERMVEVGRCPECGKLVKMPCLHCRVERDAEEKRKTNIALRKLRESGDL